MYKLFNFKNKTTTETKGQFVVRYCDTNIDIYLIVSKSIKLN